jgi:hypothetical protein
MACFSLTHDKRPNEKDVPMTISKSPATQPAGRQLVDTLLALVAGSAMILVSITFFGWLRG